MKKVRISKNELEILQKELVERISQREQIVKEIKNTLDPGHRFPSNVGILKQEANEKRIEDIQDFLKKAELYTGDFDANIIEVGAKVVINYGETQREIEIVSKDKLEIFERTPNQISEDSPLAQELIGRKVGDNTIIKLPRGDVRVVIIKIINNF